MMIAYSGTVFAESGVIKKLQETIQEWIGGLFMVGLATAAGFIMMGYVAKIKFFEYYADEYKKTLFWAVAISALCVIFQSEIASIITKMMNPLGIN